MKDELELVEHEFANKQDETTKICRLCSRKVDETKNILDEDEFLQIINKFFEIQITNDDEYHNMCFRCDKRLADMHEFEKEVNEAQNYFKILLNEIKSDTPMVRVDIKVETEDAECSVKSEPFESDMECNDDGSENVNLIIAKPDEDQDEKKETGNNRKTRNKRLTKHEAQNRMQEIDLSDQKINAFYNLTCSTCSVTVKKWQTFKSHMTKHHTDSPRITCCNTEFPLQRPVLLSHIDFHNNPEEFKCSLCNKQFMSLESKRLHEYRHKVSIQRESLGKKEQNQAFSCPDCGKTLANKHSLRGHMKLHMPDSEKEKLKVQCDLCKKFFKNKSSLFAHMNDIHRTKEKSISCDKCARNFHSYRTFLTHYRVNHTEVKMMTCPDCGSQVKSHNLRQHQRLKHDFQPQNCPICFKECRNQGYLALHTRRFHSVPKYKCDVCGKMFIIKGQWQDHYESHFNSSRFSCDRCDYVNNDYPNMIKHRKTKHPDAPPGCSKKIFQIK